MNGIATIKGSFEMSQQWLTALLADVKDTPLAFPTSKGGNHPLWVVGHLAHSEANLIAEFVLGEKNPLAKWDGLFGMGSTPDADAGKYPPFAEVLREYERARALTYKLLDSYTDADLAKPSKAAPDYEELFGTIGKCLMSLPLHVTFHAGQIADARRALGKQPVFG